MISREPYRHRWMMLGLIAWVSVCLIAAGWSSAELSPILKKMWVLAGLTGLVSAIGLSEVLKSEVQAQQQHLNALLAEARTDILTGLGNRRSFDEELDRWWAQWKRQGTMLSILLIDVDQFKELNDSYGHQAGDHVLKGIARILVNSTRAVDHVARYGGDEFAVLLLGTDVSAARVPAERLRAGIVNYKFAFGEAELQATVTVGLAEVTPADEQP
ncbi:MAG: GGDEF domain-containing protein, partial [Planctomycetota bacterium]|nr:GGDEF domain-containing protein [Planctomycetota bacterium]